MQMILYSSACSCQGTLQDVQCKFIPGKLQSLFILSLTLTIHSVINSVWILFKFVTEILNRLLQLIGIFSSRSLSHFLRIRLIICSGQVFFRMVKLHLTQITFSKILYLHNFIKNLKNPIAGSLYVFLVLFIKLLHVSVYLTSK